MIDSINHASENNKVSTLFIDLSYLSISSVSAVELGESFKTFKESGKKVIAYGDFLDQNQYLLASFANEIVLNPQGLVYLEGFKKSCMLVKDLGYAGKACIHPNQIEIANNIFNEK